MTEAPEQTPTQDTSTSKELTSPLCVVERYEPSDENWAKIKPRILEMEKACFQDRTKTPPKPYGFEEKTLETLFTRDDGTRHIMLLKIGDVIVGWISARTLGFKDNIDPLLTHLGDRSETLDLYYKLLKDYLSLRLPEGQPEMAEPKLAYMSHIVVHHNISDPLHNPPRGSAEKLERVMFQYLKENNYDYVALDAVVATDPDDDPDGYAGRFSERHKDQIVFSQRHHAYAKAKIPLPEQVHIVVDIREPIPEETVQAEQP
jgi:hypothetical protein